MNMTSSASTQKQSTSPETLTFSDVVSALEKRGRVDEAQAYYFYVSTYLDFIHGISEDEVLEMSIDDIAQLLKLPLRPLKYEGWNFYWGGATLRNARDEN